MSIVALASVSASPGVTTLCCLVAATWPDAGGAIVVECDPKGGDLAARFGLSNKAGWSSLLVAARRDDVTTPLSTHLQRLPGGVQVLVGARAGGNGGHLGPSDGVVERALRRAASETDLVLDVGRLLPDASGLEPIARLADVLCIVLRPDAASIMHVYDRVAALRDVFGDRLQLVLDGSGAYSRREVEQFTTLNVLGTIPYDPRAASVASGRHGSSRRLSRSPLVAASRRFAAALPTRELDVGVPTVEPDERYGRVADRHRLDVRDIPNLADQADRSGHGR